MFGGRQGGNKSGGGNPNDRPWHGATRSRLNHCISIESLPPVRPGVNLPRVSSIILMSGPVLVFEKQMLRMWTIASALSTQLTTQSFGSSLWSDLTGDFMDLTITKSHSFQETGTLHTKTFRKPSCKPQYLAFASRTPCQGRQTLKGLCRTKHI